MSFMRTILETVTSLLPQPRVIRNRSDTSPYLSRWYLFGKPWMPDGSSPFDASGQTREGMRWSKYGLGVYLHKFHRDDESDELHNHPWKAAVALVLAGGYVEERRAEIWDPLDDRGAQYVVEKRVVRPGTINVITANDFHRVDLIEEDSWSLFVTWRKEQSWGFWDRHTNTFTPWRQYLDEWRAWRVIPFKEKLRRADEVIRELDLSGFKLPDPAVFRNLFAAHDDGTDALRSAVVEAVARKAAAEHDDFLIVCDETNNTPEDMAAGKVKVDLFVPAKFVVDPEVHLRGTLPREGEEDAGQGQVEKSGGGKGSEEA